MTPFWTRSTAVTRSRAADSESPRLPGQSLAGSGRARAGVALASGPAPCGTAAPGVLGALPLPQKAKRVIWLTMAGGPSHLETFDPKPKLAEMHGKPMPESLTKGQQLAQLQGQELKCFGPQHPFTAFGKNQTEICSLFPQIGSVIDEICLIRSMTTDAINHDPAHMFMNTGSQIAGRPSMGAWVTYGLGSEAADLPGFVVLTSLGKGGQNQPIAARQWSSGFLPSKYQGVQMRSKGEAVLYLSDPAGITREQQGADVRADQRAEPAVRRPGRRPRGRHPDRAVRNGVSDAGERARADGPPRRSREDAGALRLPARGWLVRKQLLARPPAGRARHALHPALPQRLGPSRRSQGRHRAQGPGNRPRLHGTDHRSQATRHARRDARSCGQASLAAPRCRKGGAVAIITTRPCRCGSRAPAFAVAWSTAPPTTSAMPPWRTSARSTTYMPRCCTSSASTTKRSASSFRGSTPGSAGWKGQRSSKPFLRSRAHNDGSAAFSSRSSSNAFVRDLGRGVDLEVARPRTATSRNPRARAAPWWAGSRCSRWPARS